MSPWPASKDLAANLEILLPSEWKIQLFVLLTARPLLFVIILDKVGCGAAIGSNV
jgi:hypothetical protein